MFACVRRNLPSILRAQVVLFKTAKNLAYDHLTCRNTHGRRQRRGCGSAESAISGVEDETFHNNATQQEFKLFCDAVRALPKQCRRAFVLKKVYGYSLERLPKN